MDQQLSALRSQGIDLVSVNRAIQSYFSLGLPIPDAILRRLDQAGVPRDRSNPNDAFGDTNPLTALQRQLRREPEVQVDLLHQSGANLASINTAIANFRSRGAPMPQEVADRLRTFRIPVQSVDQEMHPVSTTPLANFHRTLRRNPHTQAAMLVARGNDPAVLLSAIAAYQSRGTPIPHQIQDQLRAVGVRIEPMPENRVIDGNSALTRVQRALQGASRQTPPASPGPQAVGPRRPGPIPSSPPPRAYAPAQGATTPDRARPAQRANLGIIPDRRNQQTNLEYALRIHRSRGDLSHEQLAQLSGASASEIREAIADAQVGRLHRQLAAMDLHAAAARGYNDGVTDCLFGETLSLSNPAQRVVALSARPVRHGVPENLAFMDLNQLARYVRRELRHPLTNERLMGLDSLQAYTLRIRPPRTANANAAGASTSTSGAIGGGERASRNRIQGHIPEREDTHSNLQYAMHVHQYRPDLSAAQLAQLSGEDPEEVRAAIAAEADLSKLIEATARELYSQLGVLSLPSAQARGFASGESACMFGETLSLNSQQRIVALSAQPVSEGLPDNVAFVELDPLVRHVLQSNRHPLTNERLEGPAALHAFTLRIAQQPDPS